MLQVVNAVNAMMDDLLIFSYYVFQIEPFHIFNQSMERIMIDVMWFLHIVAQQPWVPNLQVDYMMKDLDF